MVNNYDFGPAAQTAAARTLVLGRMKQAMPHLRRCLSPFKQQLHARYISGELTWLQVTLIQTAQPLVKARCAR